MVLHKVQYQIMKLFVTCVNDVCNFFKLLKYICLQMAIFALVMVFLKCVKRTFYE